MPSIRSVFKRQLLGVTVGLCTLAFLSGCGGACLAIGGCSDGTATSAAASDAGTPVVGPFFTATGTGDTVFKLPASVSVVDITGRFEGESTNFVVYIGGDLKINEIIGARWSSTVYSGRATATPGGLVEITKSNGVAWSITEVRL